MRIYNTRFCACDYIQQKIANDSTLSKIDFKHYSLTEEGEVVELHYEMDTTNAIQFDLSDTLEYLYTEEYDTNSSLFIIDTISP